MRLVCSNVRDGVFTPRSCESHRRLSRTCSVKTSGRRFELRSLAPQAKRIVHYPTRTHFHKRPTCISRFRFRGGVGRKNKARFVHTATLCNQPPSVELWNAERSSQAPPGRSRRSPAVLGRTRR